MQRWWIGWSLCVAMLCVACSERRVYDRYQHTVLSGWERNDSLKFNDIPRFQQAGCYTLDLGLRVTANYPFTTLTLVVDRMLYPSMAISRDTVTCSLIDRRGRRQGTGGISYFQYQQRLRDVQVKAGDSLVVYVRHYMKREMLPGISDVGILLQQQ